MAKNRKRTVLVITGTRAEYGLLLPVLRKIQQSKKLELNLLVTGAHTNARHGNTITEIQRDGVPISAIAPVTEKDSMLSALTKEIRGIEQFCLKKNPDMLLVWGDRDEALAGALVAGHLNIPLVHIGGGDVSGYGVDDRIRHAITKFAHIHFVISKGSAAMLRKLGEKKDRIHISGTTAFERSSLKKESKKDLAKELGLSLDKPWIVIVQHPTSHDSKPVRTQIVETISALSAVDAEKIWLYPNTDTGGDVFLAEMKKIQQHEGNHLYSNIAHDRYMDLLSHADLMVGNSSSGIVEAGHFHLPVINIGNRQKGRECGKNVIHVSYDKNIITRAIMRGLSPSFSALCKKSTHPYGEGKASEYIVHILEKTIFDERLRHKKI